MSAFKLQIKPLKTTRRGGIKKKVLKRNVSFHIPVGNTVLYEKGDSNSSEALVISISFKHDLRSYYLLSMLSPLT